MNRMNSRFLLFLLIAACFLNVAFAGEKVNHISAGRWGGEHVGIDVTDESAKIEFDCGHGSIDGLIPLDDKGQFDVVGVYVPEQGGPVRQGEAAGRPARYSGNVENKRMTLTVMIKDTDKEIGTFTLELGKSPLIRKCD
jgi:hypothetical protein